jgi:hypothetical protein
MELNSNQISALKEFGFVQHPTIPYLWKHPIITGEVQYGINNVSSLNQLICMVCNLYANKAKSQVKKCILDELENISNDPEDFCF